MDKKKALVIPSSGMGDGCIFLSLCYNLAQGGFKVDCVHTNLAPLQDWILTYQIYSRGAFQNFSAAFASQYDVIIINKDSSSFTQNLVAGLSTSRTPFFLFSPSSRRDVLVCENPLIWCRRNVPFLENLRLFYQEAFPLTLFEKETGIQVPKEYFQQAKEQKYIAIHASASSATRQWPLKRFIKVYRKLRALGYRPIFLFWNSPKELILVQKIDSQCESKVFSDIKSLVSFLTNCVYFIGNDSGLGHLASSLKIPALTIFNCPRKKVFWRPSYTSSMGIAPSKWIPNIKGLRIRNYAFFLIFPWQVMRKFFKLQASV